MHRKCLPATWKYLQRSVGGVITGRVALTANQTTTTIQSKIKKTCKYSNISSVNNYCLKKKKYILIYLNKKEKNSVNTFFFAIVMLSTLM